MRPQPASIHSYFFSSLKQVEKRLKLESTDSSQSQQPTSSPIRLQAPTERNIKPADSLASPLFLHSDQPVTVNNYSSLTMQEHSEPPQEFLSNCSLHFPSIHPDPRQLDFSEHPQATSAAQNNGLDDIDALMQLLGLLDFGKEDRGRRVGLGLDCCSGVHGCSDEFYAKIIGAKGPKCGKELERLEGWIKHFLNGDAGGGQNERKEPFRLAHLLLTKTAFLSQESGGFECFDIPSTIGEFLGNDPPSS